MFSGCMRCLLVGQREGRSYWLGFQVCPESIILFLCHVFQFLFLLDLYRGRLLGKLVLCRSLRRKIAQGR